MKNTPEESRRHMVAVLHAAVAHYQKCLTLIGSVHSDVVVAGMDALESEHSLALWLSQPASALGGEIPLVHAHSEKGRAEVIRILGALDHGVFL